MKAIQIIGFDADDTLWVNGQYFKFAEKAFTSLLISYMSKEQLIKELYSTEMKNMKLYGYGAMAFTLSLIETAIRISKGKVSSEIIKEIMDVGTGILRQPVVLLPGVSEVLPELFNNYKLIVVTKGDLLDQERKLENSGLLRYFHHIEVVSEKHESNYSKLIELLGINPEEFLMVGNSLKSDIIPVLSIGGNAVHIPQEEVWIHENSIKPELSFFELTSLFELPELLSGDKVYSV